MTQFFTPPRSQTPIHYYGDIVRKLFFAGGIIMLITLPFFTRIIPFPIWISILAILTIVFLAGYTNPRQKWVLYANLFVSLLGLIIFEYYAITSFDSLLNAFFWINQILAIIFFFSFYFSTKTFRGKIIKEE